MLNNTTPISSEQHETEKLNKIPTVS